MSNWGHIPCWEEIEHEWDPFTHRLLDGILNGEVLRPPSGASPAIWDYDRRIGSDARQCGKKPLEKPKKVEKPKQKSKFDGDAAIFRQMDYIEERSARERHSPEWSIYRREMENSGWVEVCPEVWSPRDDLVRECLDFL